ncbi:hypothetical protein SO802_011660 [Lithocarpus litseifolius]|uniref:Helicase C-terminal domain-containing protein n=1 Tax=Lithocarpus litseifolius TaxID=425828 RepID=A0AAW2D206_9ROSI
MSLRGFSHGRLRWRDSSDLTIRERFRAENWFGDGEDHRSGVADDRSDEFKTPSAFLNNIDPDKCRCLDFMRGVKYEDVSLEERSQSSTDLKEKGGILVCTDAAARGVDIPNASHVI